VASGRTIRREDYQATEVGRNDGVPSRNQRRHRTESPRDASSKSFSWGNRFSGFRRGARYGAWGEENKWKTGLYGLLLS